MVISRIPLGAACAAVLLGACSEAAPPPDAASAAPPAAEVAAPGMAGRFACTSSSYDAASAGYEFEARGAFTLTADGEYAYLGFEQPSAGSYRLDGEVIRFTGGYLDGGEATGIEGQPDRYYLVTPTLPGSRWTCRRQEG